MDAEHPWRLCRSQGGRSLPPPDGGHRARQAPPGPTHPTAAIAAPATLAKAHSAVPDRVAGITHRLAGTAGVAHTGEVVGSIPTAPTIFQGFSQRLSEQTGTGRQ